MSRQKFTKETRYQYLIRALSSHVGDDCLIWPFAKGKKGHGVLHLPDFRKTFAHREAYKLIHGTYPTPCGRHTCDVASCFSPRHIIPGTIAENNGDIKQRGRHRNQFSGPKPQSHQQRYGDPILTDATMYQWVVDAIAQHGTSTECLEWPFLLHNNGYPRLRDIDGKKIMAHRLVYRLTHGQEAPACVAQNCRNHSCISPMHVVATTKRESSRRAGVAGAANRIGAKNGSAKLTDDLVHKIRLLYSKGKYSQTALGKQFGVHQTVISYVIRKEHWSHI